MTKLSMRPTERRTVNLAPEQILERFQHLLHNDPEHVHGHILGNHITLRMPFEKRHFWSPWYNIEVEQNEQSPDESILHLRFSPHPSVWTAIAFGYLALVTIGTIAACYGLAQMIMGTTPLALWVVPICILLGTAVFLGAQFGQTLAREQMAALDTIVRATLSETWTFDFFDSAIP